MTPKEEKRQAEMLHGSLIIKHNMLEGLVEQLAKEMDPQHKFDFRVVASGNDPRQWGVLVDFKNGVKHSENIFDFPTDALKTKIMLLY